MLSSKIAIIIGTTVPPPPVPLSMIPYAVARRLENHEGAVDMKVVKTAPPLTPTHTDWTGTKGQYWVQSETIINLEHVRRRGNEKKRPCPMFVVQKPEHETGHWPRTY